MYLPIINCKKRTCKKRNCRSLTLIYRAPSAKLYLFCATLLYGVFPIFFKSFFGTPMAQKKIREPFFSQNQKFRKANMCI